MYYFYEFTYLDEYNSRKKQHIIERICISEIKKNSNKKIALKWLKCQHHKWKWNNNLIFFV